MFLYKKNFANVIAAKRHMYIGEVVCANARNFNSDCISKGYQGDVPQIRWFLFVLQSQDIQGL